MTATQVHNHHANTLRLRRLGIDTGDEFAIFMQRDCHICRAEDFSARTRAGKDQPLYTIHAETRGEPAYALEFQERQTGIFAVEGP